MIMNWLRRFMAGRYGTDQLSIFLLIVFLLINLAASLTKLPVLSLISLILLIFCYFRIFSRNFQKRAAENSQYMKLWVPVRRFFSGIVFRIKDSRTHRHFSCPQCHRKLRVPKKKGKIAITCPQCHHEFVKRT